MLLVGEKPNNFTNGTSIYSYFRIKKRVGCFKYPFEMVNKMHVLNLSFLF